MSDDSFHNYILILLALALLLGLWRLAVDRYEPSTWDKVLMMHIDDATPRDRL